MSNRRLLSLDEQELLAQHREHLSAIYRQMTPGFERWRVWHATYLIEKILGLPILVDGRLPCEITDVLEEYNLS